MTEIYSTEMPVFKKKKFQSPKEKGEQIKSEGISEKKTTKIRVEINEIEIRKTIEEINR